MADSDTTDEEVPEDSDDKGGTAVDSTPPPRRKKRRKTEEPTPPRRRGKKSKTRSTRTRHDEGERGGTPRSLKMVAGLVLATLLATLSLCCVSGGGCHLWRKNRQNETWQTGLQWHVESARTRTHGDVQAVCNRQTTERRRSVCRARYTTDAVVESEGLERRTVQHRVGSFHRSCGRMARGESPRAVAERCQSLGFEREFCLTMGIACMGL